MTIAMARPTAATMAVNDPTALLAGPVPDTAVVAYPPTVLCEALAPSMAITLLNTP